MGIPGIVLLDDDPQEVDTLIRLINLYYYGTPELKLSRGNPHGFTSGSATLEYFTGGKPVDIIFLDIIMPEMSGVEVASCLRAKGFGGYIVFLTSTNDFAAESYRVTAFSYLLKPVEKEQLFSVMRKIEDAQSKSRREDTAAVLVQTRQYHRSILFRDIVFAEIMGHSLSLHLVNNETVSINKPLKEFAPILLADERFAHCHGSIIVNLDFVETIKDNTVILKPGGSIPMSRRFNDFKSRYITRSIRKFMG